MEQVLHSDEAVFGKVEVINSTNVPMFGLVSQEFILGPFIIHDRLTRVRYLEFIQNYFNEVLENVPLQIRIDMVYAPSNFSLVEQGHIHAWLGPQI